jgi:hypothetical protein
MSTPKTWAANTEPTPEQLAVWLQDATHEERVQHASKVLDLSARAHDCLTRNHEGLLEERNHWIGEVHRYKRLYQASDKDAARWFKRMKVAEAALGAASAPVSAHQDHEGTEGQGEAARAGDRDWCLMDEDVTDHVMGDQWQHGDGRYCRHHYRLNAWVFGAYPTTECLRDHERSD